MPLILIGALIGAIGSFTALFPQGILIAVMGAPVGGSVGAFIAGVLLAAARGRRSRCI